MARITGVDLPGNKRIIIALTYIYGIGISTAKKILNNNSIDINKKVSQLNENEILTLRKYIEENYKVEGELKSEIFLNIKRLMDINCYRGIRHKRSLPVRGQKTRTNARTRKGKKPSIGKNKKVKKE